MELRGLFGWAIAVVLSGSGTVQADTAKRPPPQETSGTALKFHPGFYPYFNYAGGVTMRRLGNGGDGKDLALIRSLKAGDNVEGIAISIMWRTLDNGTSAPDYDWSVIDAYLAAVKSVNKRLWVRVNDGQLISNASVSTGRRIVPDWLITKYGIQSVEADYAPKPRGVASKRYNPVVTNAYIAMWQAMAARYDSDPSFEGVTMFEETAYGIETGGTSVTVDTPGADYSETAMFQQLYALMAGMRDPVKGFKTANVQIPGNYLFKSSDSAAKWTDVFNHVMQYRMMLGGPDSWIESWTYPQGVTAHLQIAGPGTTATNTSYHRALAADEVFRGWWPGSTDWRGRVLFGPVVELTDVGGYVTRNLQPLPTLADIWAVRGPKLDKAHYFFFDINYRPTGNYGTAAQQWATGQYPWVKSAGSTNTSNPYQ
jgi:hypothetical protein